MASDAAEQERVRCINILGDLLAKAKADRDQARAEAEGLRARLGEVERERDALIEAWPDTEGFGRFPWDDDGQGWWSAKATGMCADLTPMDGPFATRDLAVRAAAGLAAPPTAAGEPHEPECAHEWGHHRTPDTPDGPSEVIGPECKRCGLSYAEFEAEQEAAAAQEPHDADD